MKNVAEHSDFDRSLARELGRQITDQSHSTLERVERAFLSQHYGQKTHIQGKAVEPIFQGRNALIVSPTASGKTEAAVMPIAARILAGGLKSVCIYVCPTRALANDLHRRLQAPLKGLGFDLAIKHGDHDLPLDRKRFDVLLTTPESLDVLLGRSMDFLKDVRHVVVDEAHQIYDQPRGHHLLFLLERLKEIGQQPLQRIALSATVAEPVKLASWLKGSDTDFLTFGSEAKRNIDAEFLFPMGPQSLRNWISGVPVKKMLVFANTRRRCEEVYLSIKDVSPYEAFVHYSTLEKTDREYVEKRFKKAAFAICVATSTMELGVDIGSVDAVLLVDPPNSVSSFVQRIGRGGRRGQSCPCYLAAKDDGDLLRFCGLLDLAQSGAIEPVVEGCAYSVLVQQVFSYVASKENHRILPEEIKSFCKTWHGYHRSVDPILESLVAKGYLASEAGWRSLRMGTKLAELYNKKAIYTNIQDIEKGIAVYAQDRKLANLPLPRNAKRGNVLLFAGRYWRIESIGDSSILVSKTTPVDDPIVPRWGTRGLRNSDLLTRQIQKLLRGEAEPQGLSDSVRERVENIRREYLGCSKEWDYLYLNKGNEHIYFTFLSSVANTAIRLSAESQHALGTRVREIEMGLVSNIPIDFSAIPKTDEVEALVESNWRLFSATAPRGPFFSLLPSDLQKEETLSFLDYALLKDLHKFRNARMLAITKRLW
jgi:ATP-dependent helicase Lhr and Lhr-like helicase